MKTILCTLYNSLYLDKGLVLYDSLCECAKDFKLYVLCMDDKSYDVLQSLEQPNHIPIRLHDFESGDEELLAAKKSRSMGEYCWTCSSSLIRYVLIHYEEEICTYIDADMCFYNDPQILIDEMLNNGKSVMVVPHRFPDEKKNVAKTVGTYCVEFNVFLNNPQGLEVLEYWRERCLECCSNIGDGIHWGDQKYLEELVDKFVCVHVCEHPGAGVAPWNINLYKTTNISNVLLYNVIASKIDLIFIHFQSISYISSSIIITGLSNLNKDGKTFVKNYYIPYLRHLDAYKKMLLDRYGVNTIFTGHPADKHHFERIKRSFIGRLFYVFILKYYYGKEIARLN